MPTSKLKLSIRNRTARAYMRYIVLFIRHNVPFLPRNRLMWMYFYLYSNYLGRVIFDWTYFVLSVRLFFVEFENNQGHIVQVNIPWNHPFPVM